MKTPRHSSTYRAARRNAQRPNRVYELVTVYPAHHGQNYGGPEEGGWYYGTSSPISPGGFDYDFLNRFQLAEPVTYRKYEGLSQDRMTRRIRKIEAVAKVMNQGRRKPWSVLSRADWVGAEWVDGEDPVHLPRVRPHYE